MISAKEALEGTKVKPLAAEAREFLRKIIEPLIRKAMNNGDTVIYFHEPALDAQLQAQVFLQLKTLGYSMRYMLGNTSTLEISWDQD